MDENKQTIKELQEKIEALPEVMQKALFWIIENVDVANQLAEGEPFTDKEAQHYTQLAIEKKDYFMLALVLHKQSKNRNKKQATGKRMIQVVE